MSRLHIHITVEDLASNVTFYSALFGVEPAVVKEDYVKWMLEDPRVNFAISARGAPAGVDHLGIQADSPEEQAAVEARLREAGVSGEAQVGTTCCYARSDKYWTMDPQGVPWEAYYTLGSSPTFNERTGDAEPSGSCVPHLTRCC